MRSIPLYWIYSLIPFSALRTLCMSHCCVLLWICKTFIFIILKSVIWILEPKKRIIRHISQIKKIDKLLINYSPKNANFTKHLLSWPLPSFRPFLHPLSLQITILHPSSPVCWSYWLCFEATELRRSLHFRFEVQVRLVGLPHAIGEEPGIEPLASNALTAVTHL